MEFSRYFPIWDRLTPQQKDLLSASVVRKSVPKGTIVHNGNLVCTGVLLVKSGQLRAYVLSEEGREISVYRLFDMDVCLMSAYCMMPSIQFEITVEAEKDTDLWVIPPQIYKQLMETSAPVANFTGEVIATRLSEVMWLTQAILWKSMDKRIATFLLDESALEGSNHLRLTHETIANHLGTHREVVTRMLRYFQSEGMVKLTRGTVELTDFQKLEALQNG